MNNSDSKKQAVARAAIDFVEYDDVICVGPGSNVDFFIVSHLKIKSQVLWQVLYQLNKNLRLMVLGY